MRILGSSYISVIFFLLIAFNFSQANVTLYGSKDCVDCDAIKKTFNEASVAYEFVDVETDEGYENLLANESKLGVKTSGNLPAVMITGRASKIFYFSKELSVLDSVAKYNVNTDIVAENRGEKFSSTKKISVVYFEKAGCSACSRVNRHFEYLQKQDSSLNILTHAIKDKKSAELNKLLCVKFGVNASENLVTPAIFTDNGYLIGDKVNSIKIDSLLGVSGSSEFWLFSQEDYKKSAQSIASRFEKMTIFVVVIAALLDSINPCAYATLIFLVSYLLGLKKDKKTILFSGIAFSFSVFITYLMVGFGLLQVAQFADSYYIARTILNSLIVLALVYYGALNLHDYIMIKKNKYNKVKLSLSFESSKKINESILSLGKSKFVVLNSFLIGFVISFLELACTGQEYLPTIIYMKETTPERAIPLLILYNVVFVLPIIIIFLLVFKGLTASSLQKFIFKNTAKVKMGFFILMMFMAGVIIFTQMV